MKDWKACYKRFDEQLQEFAGEITSMDRRIELLSREEGLGGIGNDVLVQFRSDVEKVMSEVSSSYTHKIKSVDKTSSTDVGVGLDRRDCNNRLKSCVEVIGGDDEGVFELIRNVIEFTVCSVLMMVSFCKWFIAFHC